MAEKQERTKNTYDSPNTPLAVTLNTSTYTTVLAANPTRMRLTLSNLSVFSDEIIKEKAAGDPDSLVRGWVLKKGETFIYESDTIPVGEISALGVSGTPTILATEA